MNYNTHKKILMIAALGKGDDGMSFASCRLRDEWQKNGIKLNIVDFFDNGGSGVGVSNINKILATFRNYKNTKAMINDCDAVYFTPKLTLLGFLSLVRYYKLCIKRNKPYTLHIHGRVLMDTYRKYSFIRPTIRKYITKAKSNIALTQKLKEEMIELFGCGDFVVVGNFAQDEMMLKKGEHKEKMTTIKSQPMQICYMSNIIESKGIFELIDAVGGENNYILKIAGRVFPDEKIRFEKYLEEYQNIEFLGFVTKDEKRKLLKDSTVFCLPTRYPTEAQPISIIEALCMGCIIVATPLPGIVDTLGKDYPQQLYVEKDTQQIKDVLQKIGDDKQGFYDKIFANIKAYHERFSLSEFAYKIYGCVID